MLNRALVILQEKKCTKPQLKHLEKYLYYKKVALSGLKDVSFKANQPTGTGMIQMQPEGRTTTNT